MAELRNAQTNFVFC